MRGHSAPTSTSTPAASSATNTQLTSSILPLTSQRVSL
jgi:hypothetical protein